MFWRLNRARLLFIIFIALCIVGMVLAIWEYQTSVLQVSIQYPTDRPVECSGETLQIFHFDGPEGVSRARKVRDEFLSRRLSVDEFLLSNEQVIEKKMVLEGPAADVRVRPGAKLVVLLCKGYGWQEVIEIEGDASVILDGRNVGRGWGN